MGAIETDIRLEPFTGDKEDGPAVPQGVRIFLALNKAPSNEWKVRFFQALQQCQETDDLIRTAKPDFESRGQREGISVTVEQRNGVQILATIRRVVLKANDLAKGKEAKPDTAEQTKRDADEEAERVASPIREHLRGK